MQKFAPNSGLSFSPGMDDALHLCRSDQPASSALCFYFTQMSQLPAGSPIPVTGSDSRLGLSDILSSFSKGSKQRVIYSKEMKYIIMNKFIDFSLRK